MEAHDYQTAAIAAIEAAEKTSTQEKPNEPLDRNVDVPAEVDGSGKDRVLVVGKDAPVKADKKVEEAPKSRFEKSFEDLVREKAEIRKEKETLKSQSASFSQNQKLLEAAKSGDAMAILAAAGVKWDPTKPVPQKQVNPMQDLAGEVAELKAELAAAKREKVRGGILDQAKSFVTKEAAKFPYVAALGEHESALGYIETYFKENEELPIPGDWNASIELALEATENRLRKEAERFSKVTGLTSGSKVDTKTEKPVVPSPMSYLGAKTITNSTGSGPRAVTPSEKPERMSSEDYRKAAMALIESDG